MNCVALCHVCFDSQLTVICVFGVIPVVLLQVNNTLGAACRDWCKAARRNFPQAIMSKSQTELVTAGDDL